MVDWTSHQVHHGVQEQVTLTHIYRLIYRHFISSVLCLLKGILKQISGWRTTRYNYLQMGQLGQTIWNSVGRLRYATWASWELYDILPQSLFLSFDNVDAFISKWPPKELKYAEDYLNYENSTSSLLMLSKYHEFWVIIFHSANYILHAWIWSQGCIKNTREKWTGNLTNCFELCYCTKYLWYKKGCQRSAEQMISNCWDIAAFNPRSNKNWLSQVNCSCRN